MPSYVFGKSIDFVFNPIIDGVPVRVYSLTSARIYSNTPTDAQIEDVGQASTGHIGSRVTSWTDDGDFAKKITFSALTDSDPHASAEYKIHYVAVNFKYESGGPDVYLTEAIFVYRPDALTSRVTVDYTDVLKLERNLSDFFQPSDLEDFIALAKEEVFARYEGLNKKIKRLFGLEKLNICVKLKATALACFDRYNDNAPAWLRKSEALEKRYDAAFAASQVGYDNDGDDVPTPDEVARTRTVWIQR